MKPLHAFALCVALISAASSIGCDRSRLAEASTAESAAVPAAPVVQPAAPPRVATVVTGVSISRTLQLDSHLMVERDVTVVARRDGFIEVIHVNRGDHVKENQSLATLEHRDLVLSERIASLELEKEQASFERAQQLHEQAIMTKEEFEQVRLRRDTAQETLDRVRYDLDKCEIKAPFDGIVTGRFVEKGQVIKEDDSKPLFQVTAEGPLLARVYIPEWALFGMEQGQPARVTLVAAAGGADGTGTVLPARVRWINHSIDAASGSAESLVEINGGGAAVARPGMAVRVSIELTTQRGSGKESALHLVSLPKEAIGKGDLTPGQQVELRVLSKDGSSSTRTVTLGFVGDDRVEIRTGLRAGEQVILAP